MIQGWLKGLSNAKLLLFIGAASLVVAGGMYTAGYLVGSRNEARIQIREVEKRIYVPTIEYQQVQVRNIERERILQDQLQDSQRLAGQLRARLDAVPVNSCPVSGDAVGVLNEAINAGNPQAGAPGVPAGTTTTVTDLTDWSLTAINQYNDVSTRYNALIDWVEDELIDDQRTTDNRQ